MRRMDTGAHKNPSPEVPIKESGNHSSLNCHPTRRRKLKMLKVTLFLVAAFLQANLVVSQEQQQQQQQQQSTGLPTQQQLIQGMTASQMWNPYSWATPYYIAASDSWSDYLKKAQEASNQLYQQWDKSGAGNLFSAGAGFAQQAGQQAQQGAQEAVNQAQQGTQEAMNQAQQGTQEAMNQAQQGTQEAMNQAQQGAQAGFDQAQQALNQVAQ